MAYEKTNWVNGTTAVNQTNMNKIEDELEALDTGKVDVVSGKGLSTNDFTNEEKTKVDSAYQKPDTGIPETDLADSVQASLDLADSALQSVPSTYRTSAAQDIIDTGLQTSINAKSTVAVSSTGTATDEVQYITIDGVQKKLAGGGSSEVAWGEITGTLSSQTDLKSALDEKADSDDIPTKTSELTNDSGFLTSHQSLSAYRTSANQDVIDNALDTRLDTIEGKEATWDAKQSALTAGTGISIVNNVISINLTNANTESF